MFEVVKYKENYILMAYKLIESKSTKDDIKAVDDLYITDAILSGGKTCVNPYKLDERLRREYKIIEMLESIAHNFTFVDRCHVNSLISEEEKLISRLSSDKMGIVADILVKHKIIKCVDELYVK